jgi:regulator of sigma E protease
MRVDEFGLGFPPQATSYQPKDSETEYSLNWLPFGGFVRIFGEDLEDIDDDHPDKERSFAEQSTGAQVAVLVAGVVMNMVLAFLLLSVSFMIGKTVAGSSTDQPLDDRRVIITQIQPDSPADAAGLEPGNEVRSIAVGARRADGAEVTTDIIQQFVNAATSSPVALTAYDGSTTSKATVTPSVNEEGERQIGVFLSDVGTLTLGPLQAIGRGASATVNLTERTVVGFYDLIKRSVTDGDGLEQVAGPVGIADLVGDAADRGLAALFSFVALISINLAVLNLLPIPALDGGRIVFSLIEAVRGKPIPPNVARWTNGIAFALLILLMLIITYNDILRLL